MFPLKNNLHSMQKRNPDKFVVNSSNTDRYKRSTIPSMQRKLNEEQRNFMSLVCKLDNVCPQRSISSDSFVVKF